MGYVYRFSRSKAVRSGDFVPLTPQQEYNLALHSANRWWNFVCLCVKCVTFAFVAKWLFDCIATFAGVKTSVTVLTKITMYLGLYAVVPAGLLYAGYKYGRRIIRATTNRDAETKRIREKFEAVPVEITESIGNSDDI